MTVQTSGDFDAGIRAAVNAMFGETLDSSELDALTSDTKNRISEGQNLTGEEQMEDGPRMVSYEMTQRMHAEDEAWRRGFDRGLQVGMLVAAVLAGILTLALILTGAVTIP